MLAPELHGHTSAPQVVRERQTRKEGLCFAVIIRLQLHRAAAMRFPEVHAQRPYGYSKQMRPEIHITPQENSSLGGLLFSGFSPGA